MNIDTDGSPGARAFPALMRASLVGLLVLVSSQQTVAANEASPAPPAPAKGQFYGVALVSSTLAYRPPGGTLQGPQKDSSPAIGAGYFVSDALAVEIEVGPSFVSGKYASFGLIPAVLWKFHPAFYVTGRFIVPVAPELNLLVLPAFGVTHAFGGIAPFFEIGVKSAVGRGDPDLGLVHAFGLTYLF